MVKSVGFRTLVLGIFSCLLLSLRFGAWEFSFLGCLSRLRLRFPGETVGRFTGLVCLPLLPLFFVFTYVPTYILYID